MHRPDLLPCAHKEARAGHCSRNMFSEIVKIVWGLSLLVNIPGNTKSVVGVVKFRWDARPSSAS